jgi:hypothetical protein
MAEDKSWTGRNGPRTWKIAIRGSRIYLELAGAGERYQNEVDLDRYFTEERRGGLFSLQEDVQHHAPDAVSELESEIRLRMNQQGAAK